MTLSARNRLKGTVKAVTLGSVMAEVVVEVAGGELVSAITRPRPKGSGSPPATRSRSSSRRPR